MADEGQALELSPALCITSVAKAKDDWLAALSAGGALALDAGGLERVDAAGLQMLASLFRTAERDGIDVTWKAASDELRSAAALLGLAEPLKLDRVEE